MIIKQWGMVISLMGLLFFINGCTKVTVKDNTDPHLMCKDDTTNIVGCSTKDNTVAHFMCMNDAANRVGCSTRDTSLPHFMCMDDTANEVGCSTYSASYKKEQDNVFCQPKKIFIAEVYFDSGSTVLDNQEKAKLRRSLNKAEFWVISLIVTGHADDVGSQDSNLKLSIKRALVVRQFIKRHLKILDEFDDVFESSNWPVVSFKGEGEADLTIINEVSQARALNRRVEIGGYYRCL